MCYVNKIKTIDNEMWNLEIEYQGGDYHTILRSLDFLLHILQEINKIMLYLPINSSVWSFQHHWVPQWRP